MSNLQSQLELLKNDTEIKNYFENKNILHFVKKYIKIDEMLMQYFKSSENCDDKKDSDTNIQVITQQLNNIKQLIMTNNTSLENIHSNVLSSNVTVLSSLERYNSEILSGNSFKDEFKNILENFKDKIDVLSNKIHLLLDKND